MKKILIIILFAVLAFAPTANAQDKTVPSAQLAFTGYEDAMASQAQIKALENIFKKYNSPLLSEAANYVIAARDYRVDWRLLPSIAGLESSFGKHLMPESYNAYGWGGGHIYFSDWNHGIRVITQKLRENYMDKWNATNVWEIGPIYAESPTWSVRVNKFMEEIESEYERVLATTPTI